MGLSMAIPSGIKLLMVAFYQKLAKFELFSGTHFELSDDGYEIKGKGNDCMGFLIYPETMDPNGYSNGTHFWSVQSVKDEYCYRSIGVVSREGRELSDN